MVFYRKSAHLSVYCYRTIENPMHSQNGGLRRVDDRCSHHGAKYPAVTDGESAAIHVLYRQGASAGLGCKTRI